MATAYIALGSNLGDRHAHIEDAFKALTSVPRTRLLAVSSVYETDPIGPSGQGKYLNAAAALETDLDPFELLAHLGRIEQAAGRQRRERWSARTLDLDLLLYDDQVIDAPGLKVPHPRMHERRFVLEPLAEIAPRALHPGRRQCIQELLAALG